MKKKLISFWLLLSCLMLFALPVSAGISDGDTALDPSRKVYDLANLLTDAEETQIAADAAEFSEKLELDFVYVTTDDSEYKSSMAYADDFFDYNGFGFGAQRSGFLLLIDMDNRNIWISGRGRAMDLLSDGQLTEIAQDYASYFTEGTYFSGSEKIISRLQKDCLYAVKGSTLSGRFFRSLSRTGIYAVIALIISAVVTLCLRGTGKTARIAGDANGYLNRNSVDFYFVEDQYLRSTMTRTPIPRDTGGHGGGGGGHVSSSGASHSGGGAHF